MSTEATQVSSKPSQDYISRLPYDLRVCILETIDHRTPRSPSSAPSDIKQQSDLSKIAMANTEWYNDVSRYKLTRPFREKNTLVIQDLTSLLLGQAAGTVQIRYDDTVAAVLDRNGAQERLATSQLATATTWVLQEVDISPGHFKVADGTWDVRSNHWYKQTIESLDWLRRQIEQGICKPPQIISGPWTESVELGPECLMTCPIVREPVSGMFLEEDLAKAMTFFSNACSDDSIPVLHLPRIALLGLDTIPQRAVFHESDRPVYRFVRNKPIVSYPLDHTIEMNMSDCEGDWSHLERYMDKVCRDHSALLALTTSSNTSTLTLSFTVDRGDVQTAEKLAERKSSLQAVVDKWAEETNDKINLRAVFGSEPSDAYATRTTDRKFNAGQARYWA